MGCQVHDAQVYPGGGIRLCNLGHIGALSDMQVVGPLTPYQISTAIGPRGINQHVMLPFAQDQTTDDPPLHGTKRDPIKTHQAVGPRIIANAPTGTKLGTGDRLLIWFAFFFLGACCLDRLDGFRTRTHSQLGTKPKAGTRLPIDAVMSGIGIRDPLIPTHRSDPGCSFVEMLLRLLQRRIMAVYVELDTDSSSECFVHKRSIAERGTKDKGVPACGPFLSFHPVLRGGFPERFFMRISVDLNRCQSYGQCCFAAPDMFHFHNGEALEYDPAPDEARRADVIRAAKACPVQAIQIGLDEEEDEGLPREKTHGRFYR